MGGVRISRKLGIAGERNHRVTVTTMLVNGRPQVRLRLRDGAGEASKATDRINLTVTNANAMIAAIRVAIETAELDPALNDIPLLVSQSRRGRA